MSDSSQDSPKPIPKTFDDLVAFKPDSARGYFYIPSALITQAKLGDAYIIGEPGGDLTNVFTDMHDMACFLVLHGYNIHWIYQSLSEIWKVLASEPPEPPPEQIFLFFAGHGKTTRTDKYEFLGKSSNNDSPITLSDVLKWKRFKSKPIFICLATCITHTDKRGPEKDFQDAHAALANIIQRRKAIVWAPRELEEELDTSDKRITQKLLRTLREEVVTAATDNSLSRDNIRVNDLQDIVPIVPEEKEDAPEEKEDAPEEKEDAPEEKEDAPEEKEDAPEEKEDAPDILLRLDYYTMGAYFMYFGTDKPADHEKEIWEGITGKIGTKPPKQRSWKHQFWRRYVEFVGKNLKLVGEIEKDARSVFEVLNSAEHTEVSSDLQKIQKHVEALCTRKPAEWHQLKIYYLLIHISTLTKKAGTQDELEDAVCQIKGTLEENKITNKNHQDFLPERFWDYLKDQLRTLAQEQPLKPETYEAIIYFFPDDKVWLDALAKLARRNREEMEQRMRQEVAKQVRDGINALSVKLDGRIGQVPAETTLAAEIKRLDERIGQVPAETTLAEKIERLDGRISGEIEQVETTLAEKTKRLDERIGWINLGLIIAAVLAVLVVLVVFYLVSK